MRQISSLVTLLLLPIGILNGTAGVVGGIWLATLGQWRILGFGLGALSIANLGLITIACGPGLLFSALAGRALNKGKYIIAAACGLLNHFWTFVVMTAWCVGIFYVILAGYTSGSRWPFLLWAYETAAGQWAYMAWYEGPESFTSTFAAMGACMGATALMCVFLFNPRPPIFDSLLAFCIPISVVFVAFIPLVFLGLREQVTSKAR
jgi:hypothetical protein